MDQLPSKLSAEIIEWFIVQEVGAYQDGVGTWAVYTSRFPLPYSWNVVRSVCRLWRDLAQKSPRLCNRIVLTRSDVVEDLLRRAGQLPVQIMSAPTARGPNNNNGIHAFKTVLPHFSRVLRADIAITTPLLALMRHEDVQTPRETPLQHLLLNFYGLSYRDFVPSPCIFPTMDFPAIQSFSCVGGHVGICRGLLRSSLTTLVLYDLDFPLTPQQLVTYLSNCPLVESLSLRNALHWPPNGTLNHVFEDQWMSTQIIPLPRLRTVSVDDPTDMALSVYLLHHIAFPANTSVRLQRRIHSSSYDILTMATALRAKYGRRDGILGHLPEVRSVLVEERGRSVRLVLWAVADAANGPPGERSVLNIYTINDTLEDMLSFLSGLPVTKVTRLLIWTTSEQQSSGTSPWSAVLRAMPALQELLIRGTSVLQATRTLGDALRDGEDEPLVPELNILRLEPFDDVPVSDGISLGDWVAQLQEPLAYRTKRGLTLSELRLTLPVTADRIQYESLISGWSSVVAGKVELQVASEARSC